MASGNSFASLSRHSKRGVSPTEGAPQIGPGIDQKMAASLSIGAVDDDVLDDMVNIKSATLVAPVKTIPPVQNDNAVGSASGPAQTYGFSPVKNSFSGLKRSTISEIDMEPGRREYGPAASAFSHLERGGASTEMGKPSTFATKSARNDMHAIKVVTRLVQGIAFKPGSQASNAVKSAALRDQLVSVHHLAAQLAEAAAPNQDHSNWVLAHCSEAVAELVARHNEKFADALDVNGKSICLDRTAELINVVSQALSKAQSDPELGAALDALENNGYVRVTESDPGVIRDRLNVSLSGALWDIYEKVSESGFTYGLEVPEMLEHLSSSIVKSAKEINISIASVDMQVSHLQGSIRRFSGLIGAEYVAKTKRVLDWMQADKAQREKTACDNFLKEILPEIIGNARKNFFAIEKIAPKLLDDSRQESQAMSARFGGDSPAGR